MAQTTQNAAPIFKDVYPRKKKKPRRKKGAKKKTY